ncbi:uncharacterized protein N7483_004707 [Penicillium malachiteum]|uniref:uncharacterized protein n=1 Tax=Penicillium malachiteum TaxID=1324776 RepID=UPI0025497444|nr:uncharacterized protein N7483_004707 [Penicillium malachiteum]KAJ5730199.1 hypothetical protein N7483_004707 [Penicillium malachiteum]
MPRPAPKRKSAKASKASTAKPSVVIETRKKNDSHPSPTIERDSTLDPRPDHSQTPLAKSHEQALESSPTGDRPGTASRPGTGSRPPTRSRGYSSTLSFAGRKGDGNSRAPGTPGFETSVLSNFRRRPRQQSILQMMQAEDGSSDLDDDDFLGGLTPQDESTPLNVSRGKSLLVQLEKSPSPEDSTPSSGGSRKRKREEIQVPESSAEQSQAIVPDSPSVHQSILDSPTRQFLQDSPGRQSLPESPSATPVPRRSPIHSLEETEAESTPRPLPLPFSDILSQTFAPPASSPAMSSRSSTIGPNAGDKKSKLTQLSTAILQNKFLPLRRPRRRQRGAASEFDLPSDESDGGMHSAASGDEDELNYLPVRKTRRARSSKPNSKPKPLGRKRSQSNQKQKKNQPRSASGTKPSAPQDPASHSNSNTGGEVDKENDLNPTSRASSRLSSPGSNASDSEVGTGRRYMSAELRAAAKKFAEIDQWEMEFEEVSASEMTGSPR